MFILILLGVAIIVTLLAIKTEESLLGISSIFIWVCLVLVLTAWPICYMETLGKVKAYEATMISVENAREYGNQFELAAIQHRIVDLNRWLAVYKYWNGTIFDCYIPDEVDELEYLK